MLDAETVVDGRLAAPPDVDAPGQEPDDGQDGKPTDAEHNPSLDGLAKTLKHGAAISAVALVATQLMSLTQTVVVARLLTPGEIGAFTLGSIFASFLVTLADGGMRAALIQRQEEVEDAANTAFWVSLVTGALMALGALAASPLLGLFFNNRIVGLVAAATCGTLLIHSLLNVPEAMMQRAFNFKRRLIVDPTTAGTFATGAIVLSAVGFGVWGLVIALYASQTATLIAVWLLARWRPGKGRFTFRIWREMAGYAYPLIISAMVENLRDVVQSAIVGRRLSVGDAGQYRYGRRIGILPGTAIIQVASYVLFPAFARLIGDAARFRDGFLRALTALWTATIPFTAVLVALGQPLIIVLLGRQWEPAGAFVAAMAGFGPGAAMSAVGYESIKGSGHSRRINYLTATTLVVGLGGVIVLIPLGLAGVGLAASIEGLASGALSLYLARDIAGITAADILRRLVPPVVAAVPAGLAAWFLENRLLQSADRPVLLGLLFLALDGIVLMTVFVGVLWLIAPDSVRMVAGPLAARLRGRRAAGEETPDRIPFDPAVLDAPTVMMPAFSLDPPTERFFLPSAAHYVRSAPPPRPTPPDRGGRPSAGGPPPPPPGGPRPPPGNSPPGSTSGRRFVPLAAKRNTSRNGTGNPDLTSRRR